MSGIANYVVGHGVSLTIDNLITAAVSMNRPISMSDAKRLRDLAKEFYNSEADQDNLYLSFKYDIESLDSAIEAETRYCGLDGYLCCIPMMRNLDDAAKSVMQNIQNIQTSRVTTHRLDDIQHIQHTTEHRLDDIQHTTDDIQHTTEHIAHRLDDIQHEHTQRRGVETDRLID